MKSQPTALRGEETQQEIRPCYLYRFTYTDGISYYMAAYDADVVIVNGPAAFADPQTFERQQIRHERPSQSADAPQANVNIQLATTDARLRKYFLVAQTETILVEIYRVNSKALPGPVDYTGYMYLEFKGLMTGVSFNDYAITGACVSLMLYDDRPVPRMMYSKTCQYQLYGRHCKVNKDLYKVSLAITSADRISRTVVIPIISMTVDSPGRTLLFTNETFMGGLIEDQYGFKAGIMVNEVLSTTTRLYLLWWPLNLTAGDTITLYVGCNRLYGTCNANFNNLPNFPGQPFLPTEGNPAVDGISV